MKVLPMQDIRVLDTGHAWAGPLLGCMFADTGAKVIKVSHPHRQTGVAIAGGVRLSDASPDQPQAYHGHDRRKWSITLNLTYPQGKELYKRLVAISDVVIENFAARVMPSLGLDYNVLKEVNPRIIMASLSATGATPGPWRDLVTVGPALAGLYGLKGLLGYHDDPQPQEDTADLDPTSAAQAFVVICAALEYRKRTGRGQFIDMAQGEAAIQRIAEPVMDYLFNRRIAGTQGNRYPGIAPHGVYRCSGDDNWLSIVVRDDGEWASLLRVAGAEEPRLGDERFADLFGRLKHQDELDAVIECWTANHDAMDLTQTLQAAGVAAFPVMGPLELLADPNYEVVRSRHVRVETPPSVTIDQIYQGIPWKLTKTPGIISRPNPQPGEHNGYILQELLGLSPADIDQLRQEAVIS